MFCSHAHAHALMCPSGMEINVIKDAVTTRALTKVPFLKVPIEEYDLAGDIRNYQRRDLRKGTFFGYLRVQPDGGINLYYKWGAPYSGERFMLQSVESRQVGRYITH